MGLNFVVLVLKKTSFNITELLASIQISLFKICNVASGKLFFFLLLFFSTNLIITDFKLRIFAARIVSKKLYFFSTTKRSKGRLHLQQRIFLKLAYLPHAICKELKAFWRRENNLLYSIMIRGDARNSFWSFRVSKNLFVGD